MIYQWKLPRHQPTAASLRFKRQNGDKAPGTAPGSVFTSYEQSSGLSNALQGKTERCVRGPAGRTARIHPVHRGTAALLSAALFPTRARLPPQGLPGPAVPLSAHKAKLFSRTLRMPGSCCWSAVSRSPRPSQERHDHRPEASSTLSLSRRI